MLIFPPTAVPVLITTNQPVPMQTQAPISEACDPNDPTNPNCPRPPRPWRMATNDEEEVKAINTRLASNASLTVTIPHREEDTIYDNGLLFEVQYRPDIVQGLLANYQVIQR